MTCCLALKVVPISFTTSVKKKFTLPFQLVKGPPGFSRLTGTYHSFWFTTNTFFTPHLGTEGRLTMMTVTHVTTDITGHSFTMLVGFPLKLTRITAFFLTCCLAHKVISISFTSSIYEFFTPPFPFIKGPSCKTPLTGTRLSFWFITNILCVRNISFIISNIQVSCLCFCSFVPFHLILHQTAPLPCVMASQVLDYYSTYLCRVILLLCAEADNP